MVFSKESVLHIRWPMYWSSSFNISAFNEYSGLISFRNNWLDLLAVYGTLKSFLQHHSSKASSALWFLYSPTLTSTHDYWKNHTFDQADFCWQRYICFIYICLQKLTPGKNLKICPFHYRGLNYESRKSRNTCSNRQIWPWSTEWSRTKDNRVLPRESPGHSKHPLPTTQ